MKLNQNLLVLVSLLICILSCNRKSKNNSEKFEITKFYFPIRLDTIRHFEKINIENDIHQLELRLFSLNDSAVISKFDEAKEITHNWQSEIILKKDNDTIIYKKLTKEVFKDVIDIEEFETLIFSGIGYKSIRSNRLFFNVVLKDPFLPTFETIETELGIFFRTNKKEQLSFNEFKKTYK